MTQMGRKPHQVDGEDLENIRKALKHQKEWASASDFDIKLLDDPRSTETPEKKLEVITVYLTTGSLEKTAKITGVAAGKIQNWKAKSLWWKDAVYKLRQTKQEELDGMFTGLIHRTALLLEDRLDNGDVILSKTGKQTRKPIPAKELASILDTIYNKRAAMRGDPTARIEHTSQDETMNRMLGRFEEMAQKMKGDIINITPEVDNAKEEEL